MSKYAIAFVVQSGQVRHKIVEGESKDLALRAFFNEVAGEFYSEDEKGFIYFKDDFFDETSAIGSIIEL